MKQNIFRYSLIAVIAVSLSLITTGQAFSQITPVKIYATGSSTDSRTGDALPTWAQKFNQNDFNLSLTGTASGTDTYLAPIAAPSSGFYTGITAPTAYSSGQVFRITFTNANTGAATLNVNSIGAKDIKKAGGVALEADDIPAGSTHQLYYNGTYLQLLGGGGSSGASSFADLEGDPSDNTALAAALDLKASITYVDSQDAGKQNLLVSGTNIKTINGSTILGSGDLVVSGSGAEDKIDNGDLDPPTQNAVFDADALKQDLDADLTAVAALGSTGIAVRTASNTWAQRTVTGTSNEITVSNGDGVSGNPTLSISTSLVIPSGATATTQAAGDNDTSPATTAFVKTYSPKAIILPLWDDYSTVTTATGLTPIYMPYAMTVTAVYLSCNTAQSSGSIITVQIQEGGVNILSTALTLDNSETHSSDATPPVISDTSLAQFAKITASITQVGVGCTGPKIYIVGY